MEKKRQRTELGQKPFSKKSEEKDVIDTNDYKLRRFDEMFGPLKRLGCIPRVSKINFQPIFHFPGVTRKTTTAERDYLERRRF